MAEPLSGDELRAWRTFIETSWALHTYLEDELRASTGLSMNDYHVMVVLSEAPEHRLRMGELADRLVFSPSRITYQISSMVKRGLVRKQPCSEDGRGQEAVLTGDGLAALEAAAPHHLITVRDSFIDLLEPGELDVLARVFERVRVSDKVRVLDKAHALDKDHGFDETRVSDRARVSDRVRVSDSARVIDREKKA